MRAFLAIGLLAACAVEPELGETTQGVLASPGFDDEGGGCPVWGCGSNSPVMAVVDGKIDFHELNEVGEYNAQWLRITRFEKNGVNYRPDVIDSTLYARNIYTGALVTSDVKGMRFKIYDRRNYQNYFIEIAEVNYKGTYLWARNPNSTTARLIPTYELVWYYETPPPEEQGPITVMHHLCGEGVANDAMAPFTALFFDDDRIDADGLRVIGASRDWFNIGCRSHALAKQHLTGHTKAAADILGITPMTYAQRTANLKMITGDYCGNGNPFTLAGMPLHWQDEYGYYNDIPTSPGPLEARWTENGAACLNTPRVDYQGTNPTFPGGVDSFLANPVWCSAEHPRPPPCTDNDVTHMNGAHTLSVNSY